MPRRMGARYERQSRETQMIKLMILTTLMLPVQYHNDWDWGIQRMDMDQRQRDMERRQREMGQRIQDQQRDLDRLNRYENPNALWPRTPMPYAAPPYGK
jgi:hypothetical protein